MSGIAADLKLIVESLLPGALLTLFVALVAPDVVFRIWPLFVIMGLGISVMIVGHVRRHPPPRGR